MLGEALPIMKTYSERIELRIRELVKNGDTKLVIYPFGEQGRLTKSILNAYFGIEEVAIVDNLLAKKYPTIISVEELKMRNIIDAKVLLTSDRMDIHDELLRKIYEVLPEMEVLELFPDWLERAKEKEEAERHLTQVKFNRKQVLDKAIRGRLVENSMCYSPTNTNASFFLPYVYMDLIQGYIFLQDDYFERRMLDFIFFKYENGKIFDYIRNDEDGIILDIGANIGNHSLYLTKELRAKKVVAFEPIKETYWILEKNVEINDLKDRVEVHKVGLSDKKGVAGTGRSYRYENIGGTGLCVGEDGGIPLAVLDDFGFENVLFIKIDVEGMEALVLRGAVETIKKSKPYIWVESFADNFKESNQILTEMGYHQYIELGGHNYLYYDGTK